MEGIKDAVLSEFLKNNDRVLICVPAGSPAGQALEEAVTHAGGTPVFWGPDLRWSALLRQAFTGRHKVIAGPPLLLLGLSKLSKQRGTPLFIRNAILVGGCADWIRGSIETGLDCRTWPVSPGVEELPLPRDLQELQDWLLRWSSVIDCRLVKGTYGLEMQIVSIPGKKLPEFPTCAKLDNQPFDSERHIPFYLEYDPENLKNH